MDFSAVRYLGHPLAVFLLVLAFLVSPGLAAETNLAGAHLPSQLKRETSTTLRAWGSFATDAPQTFLVIHGLGGTQRGDRFETLCEVLKGYQPKANVVLVDWTAEATEKLWGFYNPTAVAKKIDLVAADAAALLQEQRVAPQTITAIGESFGVYVAGRIGLELVEIRHILAFNPANELGGYAPLDLRKVAQRSCSFHTYSPYDTLQPVADRGLFLETPAGANHSAQHTFGMIWLADRLRDGDVTWLALQREVEPSQDKAMFDGIASLTGDVQRIAVPRSRPENDEQASNSPAVSSPLELTSSTAR
jgi:hypothetical protein